MDMIEKAYAITDAKISFVSLVDKAANKRQFLITKADEGQASFSTVGKILKTDTEHHFVTGIVYEPMTEDTQGNYMTEAEITKAAHWFAKNGNSVDIQHCFQKADGVEVVESYVTKSDMEINGQPIKKGTWIMTAEVTNSDIWTAIEKGEITGFSMGGIGVYSEEDVDLTAVTKADEPKGLFKKLAKSLGFDVVRKGAVKEEYQRRVKEDNFYNAWYALRHCLEKCYYNEKGEWVYDYNSDESVIREALSDFNDIVTNLLTSDVSILKSLEKAAKEAPEQPIEKAGKSISSKNLNAIKGIYDTLGSFISEFDTQSEDEAATTDTNNVKKEDIDMTQDEVKVMIGEAVTKAMEPINEKLADITKAEEPVAEPTAEVTKEDIAKMVGEAVTKAMEPITKALEPVMKSRALPGNLNDATGTIEKNEEQHYMTGMF